MPTLSKKRTNFLESEDGLRIRETLDAMVIDARYNTTSSYSSKIGLYPDNLIPFTDKHMAYLSLHPTIDPDLYVANIRMMTKKRG